MNIYEEIKNKLNIKEWDDSCDKLLDFINNLRKKYNNKSILINDVFIMETNNNRYADYLDEKFRDWIVLDIRVKKGKLYWTYAVYRNELKEREHEK